MKYKYKKLCTGDKIIKTKILIMNINAHSKIFDPYMFKIESYLGVWFPMFTRYGLMCVLKNKKINIKEYF